MKNVSIQNIGTLTGHKGAVFALAPGLTPHTFFSGDGNGWVVKWDMTKRNQGELIAKVPSNIFALCLIKEKGLLVVGAMQGILYFIDLAEKKVIPPTLQFSTSIFDVKVHQHHLYIADGTGVLSLFDLHHFKLKQSFTVTNERIRSISIVPDQQQIVLGCSNHQTYLLDISTHNTKSILKHHTNSVFATHFVEKGPYLVTGGRDASMAIWEYPAKDGTTKQVAIPQLIQSIPAHLFTVNSIAQSPDGQWLATGSRDKSIKIWDIERGFTLRKVIDFTKPHLQAHKHSVNHLLWLPHQQTLVSGSDDRTVKLWRVRN